MDFLISFISIILFLLLGQGIFEDEFQDGGSTSLNFEGFIVLYIIFSVIAGSIIFLFIFTKFTHQKIRILYGFVLSTPFILLFYEIIAILSFSSSTIFVKLIMLTILLVLPIFILRFFYIYVKGIPDLLVRNIGILVSAVVIGRMMGIFLDLLSIIIFSILISIFDIYSVFRGPLSRIMGKPKRMHLDLSNEANFKVNHEAIVSICQKGTPVVVSKENTVLGIGDILFFAILLEKSILVWGWGGFLLTLFSIMMGSLGTLYLLTKISPLPGLPIPVFISMISFALLIIFSA